MFQRTIKYDLCSNGLATSSVQFLKKVQTNAEAFAKWHLYMCNALWVKVRYYYVRYVKYVFYLSIDRCHFITKEDSSK